MYSYAKKCGDMEWRKKLSQRICSSILGYFGEKVAMLTKVKAVPGVSFQGQVLSFLVQCDPQLGKDLLSFRSLVISSLSILKFRNH